MDLAVTTGAVETIDLAGERFPVRLLTLKEWGDLTAWLKRANPSPVTRAAAAVAEARAGGMPLDATTRDELFDHAQRSALNWPPRLGSTAWFDAFDRCEGGQAQLVYQVLTKTDPAFTLERAEALAPRFTTHDWNELLRVALYGAPPRDPKATAAEEAA